MEKEMRGEEKRWIRHFPISAESNIHARPCQLCTCFSHFLFSLSHLFTICLILSFSLCFPPYAKHTWNLFAIQEMYCWWSGTFFDGYPKGKGRDFCAQQRWEKRDNRLSTIKVSSFLFSCSKGRAFNAYRKFNACITGKGQIHSGDGEL